MYHVKVGEILLSYQCEQLISMYKNIAIILKTVRSKELFDFNDNYTIGQGHCITAVRYSIKPRIAHLFKICTANTIITHE